MILLKENSVAVELPVKVKEADLPFFKKISNYSTSATPLLNYRNCFVFDNGIMMDKFHYVHQSISPSYKAQDYGKKFLIKSLLKFNKRILPGNKEYTVAFDSFSEGYFHWFVDTLPRIFLYKKYLDEKANSSTLLLPEAFKISWYGHTLEQLGITNIVWLKRNSLNFARTIHLIPLSSGSGTPDPFIFRELSATLKKLAISSEDKSTIYDKIYISRGKALKRKITNEQEVIDYLRSKGFAILYFEDFAFVEQVKLANRSQYLISIHGAGLTNMMFMNEGTSVMELKMDMDKINYCYYWMASALRLKYFYQFCKSTNPALSEYTTYDISRQQADIWVDMIEFRKNVEQMLMH